MSGFGSEELGLYTDGFDPGPPSYEELMRAQTAARMREQYDALHGGQAISLAHRAIASASPDDPSKIKALENLGYRDVMAYPGGGNFVMRHPTEDSWRVYNPGFFKAPLSGLASLGPEVAEMVGGTLGAVPAGAAGLAMGGPVGAGVGGAAGFGVGSQAARESYLWALRQAGAADERTAGQVVGDVAGGAALNAVLPPVISGAARLVTGPTAGALRAIAGPVIGRGGGEVAAAVDALNAGAPAAARITGISAGDLTGSQAVQGVQSAIAHTPFGGPIRNAARSAAAQLEGRSGLEADALAAGLAPTGQAVGELAQTGARRAVTNWETHREALDSVATNLIGAQSPVSAIPLQSLRRDLVTEMNAAERSLRPRYEAALETIDRALGDARTVGPTGPLGHLPYEAWRKIRTDIGKEMDWPGIGQPVQLGGDALERTYGRINDMLRAHADAQGPAARAALDAHDAAVQSFRVPGGTGDMLRKFGKEGLDPEAVTRALATDVSRSGAGLAALRANMPAADFRSMVGGLVHDLGQGKFTNANVTGEWSPMAFAKNFNRMMSEAGGTRAVLQGDPALAAPLAAWTRIARIGEGMASTQALTNPSHTAAALMVLSGLGHAAGDAATGNVAGLGKAAAATIAGAMGGRLMVNPNFTRWLAETAGDAMAHGMPALERRIGRLGAIAADLPEEEKAALMDYQAGLLERMRASRSPRK